MRILTIVTNLGPGGTERVAQNGAIAYRLRGHESAILAYQAGGVRQAATELAGVTCFIGGSDPAESDRAQLAAIAWGPQAIHIHRTGHPNPEAAAILRRIKQAVGRRIPVIETNVFARVDDTPDRALIDVHMPLTRWCLWKWLNWSQGLRPRPLGVVIPNMVNTDPFTPLTGDERGAFRDEHGIPRDAVLFGRVGQPALAKWSSIILDAFEQVAQRDPRAWFLSVGLPPELDPRVRAFAPDVRRRFVQIKFLHGDALLRRAYGSMDVFVHAANIGESFGLVLCEAMLCGTPVVTRASPAKDNSQVEVVGHERGGLVVNDAATMRDAMERLARDADLRSRLGAAGRRWVIENYGVEPVSALLLGLFEHIHRSSSREELERRLAVDPRMITRVTNDEIRRLLRASLGAPAFKDLLLLRMVSNPLIYKQYTRLKALKQRVR